MAASTVPSLSGGNTCYGTSKDGMFIQIPQPSNHSWCNLYSHDIDADEVTILDHAYFHDDATPEYATIRLKRHDDGTSEASYHGSKFNFGALSLPLFMGGDADSDDAEWDSDMDF